MVVKIGGKWQVQSKKGKSMGTYDSKDKAERRLAQIESFKAMSFGKNKPEEKKNISEGITPSKVARLQRDLELDLRQKQAQSKTKPEDIRDISIAMEAIDAIKGDRSILDGKVAGLSGNKYPRLLRAKELALRSEVLKTNPDVHKIADMYLSIKGLSRVASNPGLSDTQSKATNEASIEESIFGKPNPMAGAAKIRKDPLKYLPKVIANRAKEGEFGFISNKTRDAKDAYSDAVSTSMTSKGGGKVTMDDVKKKNQETTAEVDKIMDSNPQRKNPLKEMSVAGIAGADATSQGPLVWGDKGPGIMKTSPFGKVAGKSDDTKKSKTKVDIDGKKLSESEFSDDLNSMYGDKLKMSEEDKKSKEDADKYLAGELAKARDKKAESGRRTNFIIDSLRGKKILESNQPRKIRINEAKESKVNAAGNYTKPTMRKELFKKIMAGTKGGDPGEWSARKAQLLAREYKKSGGGYKN